MSIKDKEDQLFKEWAKKRKPFVRDGVVSEEHYRQSNPKIVFILKEANDKKDKNGVWGLKKYYDSDLRKYLDAGARWQTWDNVARWVDGIRKFSKGERSPFREDITKEFRIEILKSICSMNLKKTPGGGSASQEWVKVAEEDRDFIQKQYALYNPDITICGGTGEEFKHAMRQDQRDWKCPEDPDNDGIWWYEREAGKYVIYTKHPQPRYPRDGHHPKQLQKKLMDVIRKIYKERR